MKNDLPITSSRGFTAATWDSLVDRIASSFSLDENRTSRLRGNATAKLIASLPYIAGCKEPERTALSHLGTFILASSSLCKAAFDHKPDDDDGPLARAATIANFQDGDPDLISRGMKIIALVLIAGYRRDLEKDRVSGEYNPIVSGAWNAEEKITRLLSETEAIPCAEMDAVLSPRASIQSFWDW